MLSQVWWCVAVTPWADTTPLDRHHPPGQTPLPWADTTPLGRHPHGRHPWQTPPSWADTTQVDTPGQIPPRADPQADSPQVDTLRWLLQRMVHILLEYILILVYVFFNMHISYCGHNFAINHEVFDFKILTDRSKWVLQSLSKTMSV